MFDAHLWSQKRSVRIRQHLIIALSIFAAWQPSRSTDQWCYNILYSDMWSKPLHHKLCQQWVKTHEYTMFSLHRPRVIGVNSALSLNPQRLQIQGRTELRANSWQARQLRRSSSPPRSKWDGLGRATFGTDLWPLRSPETEHPVRTGAQLGQLN